MRKHRKDQVLRGFNRLRALKNRGCQSGENDNIASWLLALHRLGARECNMTRAQLHGAVDGRVNQAAHNSEIEYSHKVGNLYF